MPSVNKIQLVGRLTHDVEIVNTSSDLSIAKFSVAVDRKKKTQSGDKVTDFFRCTAFRKTAEFAQNYCSKGRLVFVEGRVEINKGTGRDGTQRDYIDIIVENIELLDSNKNLETVDNSPTKTVASTSNEEDVDPFGDE